MTAARARAPPAKPAAAKREAPPAARVSPVSFTATLRKRGVNPYVAVPRLVSERFGRRGNVPVQATLKGRAFPQTLVPVGDGRHILHVNGPMLRHAQAAVGERITFALVADPKSRMPPMHPALAAALEGRPRARAAFAALRPSRRKDVLRYLHHLKSEAALERNVARFVASLESPGVDLPMGM